MAEEGKDARALFDAEKNAEIYADFAERSQKIVNAFLERQKSGESYAVADPVEIGKMFMDCLLYTSPSPRD